MLSEVRMLTSTPAQIREHLISAGPAFIDSLEKRTEIDSYARRLSLNAVLIGHLEDKQIASLCAFYMNLRFSKVHISNVSVDFRFQRRGLATELLTFLEEHIKNLSPTTWVIELEVSSGNLQANLFYAKLGFVPHFQGHTDFPGGSFVKMSKTVN